MSFDKLDKEELIRTADEDFAFALSDDEKKSKKSVLVAFAEAQLKFQDYLEANPDQKERFQPTPVVEPRTMPEKETKSQENARTKGGLNVTVDKILVKMERENPLFEHRRYRFTKTHPYVLMDTDSAQELMTKEKGFRQAFPKEVDEYYS